MNSPVTETKRVFPWIQCLCFAVLLVILAELLFPFTSGRGPDSARRALARSDMGQICIALKHHAAEYGSMPSGNHAQILSALRGANPLNIVFLDVAPKRSNANGEYLDPWGTPFHIDTSNPAFPWAYSFGHDTRDNGGSPGSDDIPSWR